MTFADPRATAPLPITAGTVPFTPPALDPWGAFNRDLPMLEAKLAAATQALDDLKLVEPVDAAGLAEQEAKLIDLQATRDAAAADLDARRQHARDAAARIGTPPTFMIKVPTTLERDMLNPRLLQLGLTTASDEAMRASMIEALYEIDWKSEIDGVGNNEAYADDLADFLDGYWQREQIEVEARQRWNAQETERLLDIAAGAPVRPAEEKMPRLISPREAAKAKLLGDRVLETPRLRKLLAKKLDFSRRNALLLVRMHVVAVTGIEGVSLSRDVRDDALEEQAALDLRETLEQRYGKAAGEAAWLELVTQIDRLYSLDEFEMGNSASPLEKRPDRTGSTEPNGAIATSGGFSTASNTDPVPAAGSETNIANSSGSGSGGTISSMSPGQTAAASPPSPFGS
ncbi:MAG: hypothetical protein K2X76_05200 [Sphingomonas sp.]|nr:hypothetical protein [Sphingomonas sp.]